MMEYIERSYRRELANSELVAFQVKQDESDLAIYAESNLEQEATLALKNIRSELVAYCEAHKDFTSAMGVIDVLPSAPDIVRTMQDAALRVNIGPMAAVAGTVAEAVGRALLPMSKNVIVENGGDIFIASTKERVIKIFAGASKLSSKIGVKIAAADTPIGVCTSSAKVGPSISFGKTDAATVIAKSTALADAAATSLGNRVRNISDLQPALEAILAIEGVKGAAVILGDTLGACGEMEFVE